MNKYIAIDTETGGIGPEADLLTAYFGVLDENLNITSEIIIMLRPDDEDGFYHVSAKALEINKIDIQKHFKQADPQKVAAKKLYDFLKAATDNGKNRLIPIGHNVAFDIRKISEKLMSKKTLDAFLGYRVLDTGTLGQFFQAAGLIPADISASLGNLLKHFGLEFEGEAHTERADALACVSIIKKMLEIVKK